MIGIRLVVVVEQIDSEMETVRLEDEEFPEESNTTGGWRHRWEDDSSEDFLKVRVDEEYLLLSSC